MLILSLGIIGNEMIFINFKASRTTTFSLMLESNDGKNCEVWILWNRMPLTRHSLSSRNKKAI